MPDSFMFTDPMDDPMLSNFTDISSLLQDGCPLLSAAAEPEPCDCLDRTPATAEQHEVAVLDSSKLSVTEDKTLDLSECIELLTSSPSQFSNTTTTLTNTTPSSSIASSSSSSSIPSPADSLQTSLLLCNFDFSANLLQQQETFVAQSAQISGEDQRKRKSLPSAEASPETTKRLRLSSSSSSSASASEPTTSDVDKQKTRRDRNNKACQVSRAKRRQHRLEMSQQVGRLEAENERLRQQESELAVEIEKMKNLLLARLVNKQK